jgi:hypothetical protein
MTKYERLRELLQDSVIASTKREVVILTETHEQREKLHELLEWFAHQGTGLG